MLAARVHLQISQDKVALQNGQITEAVQLASLRAAAVCALLCSSGERRDEHMQALSKDERMSTLPLDPLVKKCVRHRLLRQEDIDILSKELSPHQQSAMMNAIAEHNLKAASKLYKNISTSELAQLLLTDAKTAEKAAASMVSDSRLAATISQLTQTITFSASEQGATDTQVAAICASVENLQPKVRAALS